MDPNSPPGKLLAAIFSLAESLNLSEDEFYAVIDTLSKVSVERKLRKMFESSGKIHRPPGMSE